MFSFSRIWILSPFLHGLLLVFPFALGTLDVEPFQSLGNNSIPVATNRTPLLLRNISMQQMLDL